MTDLPLLSVVIPIYGTEKHLPKCLDSILNQTMDNIEIIAVNDCSTDSCSEILRDYASRHTNIKVINHEKNKGLFHARITGVEHATGIYIGFVDSDDYVSEDYFREMVAKARSTDSDIVVGKTVHVDSKGYAYVHNSYATYDFGTLEGETISDAYWKQEGYCFIWHSVWNKIYSHDIWRKALPYLKEQEKHLIMTEDFAFSSVLFSFAGKLTSVEYGCYFYLQHDGASTSLAGGIKKFLKNIGDLGIAFAFVKNYLIKRGLFGRYGKHFSNWERLYSKFWYDNVERAQNITPEEHDSLLALIKELLEQETLTCAKIPENYFYKVSSKWNSSYNSIVSAICSPDVKLVSFDIFDTLVVRPLYKPTDLFRFMDGTFEELCPTEKRLFSSMRIDSEISVRKRLGDKFRKTEEVTLDEIYDCLIQSYNVAPGISEKMKALECSLEVKLCRQRKSAKNLFDISKACGKTVAITSDMYLPEEVIKDILTSCGYDSYDIFLLSCTEQKTKRTGSLYRELAELSKEQPDSILHIGDNWNSDIERARRNGMRSMFYPSAIDCIQYNISDISASHACCFYTEPAGAWINMEKSLQYLGTRCALAVSAVKLYDNPFVSFNEWSEVNCDPRFLGYFPLGMHMLGVGKWLVEDGIRNEYDSIAFIARDGYLPKKAFDIIRRYYALAPESSYFYISRKSSIPCCIENPEDLYVLSEFVNLNVATPTFILDLIEPLIDKADKDAYSEQGVILDEPIKTTENFNRVIAAIIKLSYNETKALSYRYTMREYFSEYFADNTAIFDIGYSGRTQAILSQLLGKAIDAYYIHENDETCMLREKRGGFKVHSFYDYTPAITGVAREYLISEYVGSCIGYDTDGGTVSVKLENMAPVFQNEFCINELQKAAIEFVSDFMDIFGDYADRITFRNIDISLPYEYVLHNFTEADSHIFDCCDFEDDMWAGRTFNLAKQWLTDISYHKLIPFYKCCNKDTVQPVIVEKVNVVEKTVEVPITDYGVLMNGKNRFEKLLFLLAIDRKLMWTKIKGKFKRSKNKGFKEK